MKPWLHNARVALRTGALAAAAIVHGSATAHAASPDVVVVWADGARRDAMASEASSALATGYTVADTQSFLDQLGRDAHLRIRPVLGNATARARLVDHMRRAARAVGVDAVVLITRVKGHDPELLAVDVATEKSAHKRVALQRLGDAVRSEVNEVHSPPSEGDSDSAPSATWIPDAAAPSADPERAGDARRADPPGGDAASADRGVATPGHRRNVPGQELVELAAGVEVGGRHLRYSDGLTSGLRPYDLGAAPLAAVEGAVYPFTSSPVLEDIGLIAGYARAFGLQSTAADGATTETSWNRYHLGARIRLRTGTASASPLLGFSAAYAAETFSVNAVSLVGVQPSVDYRFVRAAADVRVPLGRAALFADAAWLATLSGGEVSGAFTHSQVGGVDAGLGGAVALAPGLEVRLTASYRRFFYTMNSVPGDAHVAGGALDQFEGLQGSVAYVY